MSAGYLLQNSTSSPIYWTHNALGAPSATKPYLNTLAPGGVTTKCYGTDRLAIYPTSTPKSVKDACFNQRTVLAPGCVTTLTVTADSKGQLMYTNSKTGKTEKLGKCKGTPTGGGGGKGGGNCGGAPPSTTPAKKLSAWEIIMIVFGDTFGLLFIALLIWWLVIRGKKKKRRSSYGRRCKC